jgi:decaprenyl-phosphate phosphoribosyltransferase
MPRATALLRATRPRQWPKNALTLAPVLAAGAWGRAGVLSAAAVALVAFTLVASAVYLVNDVCDAAHDRMHPVKRSRPIASGRLPVSWALTGAVVAGVGAFVFAGVTHHGELGGVLAGYLAVSLAYSLGLKNLPGLEILIVAYGFVWRPVAGAEATGIAASGWFLEVCCGAALTVAIGKRLAELVRLRDEAGSHRSSLRFYRPGWLRWARRVSSVATVACYLGWAVTRWHGPAMVVAIASTLPVAFALHRYASRNDRGHGGAPEDLLLRDRPLQLSALVWLATFIAIGHV